MKTNLHEYTEELAKKIGQEGGDYFVHCYYEWSKSWIRWAQFKNLFASGPERIELLKKSSDIFFSHVFHSFFEHTVICICRLTDPAESGRDNRNKNMSVLQLRQFIQNPESLEKLDILYDTMNKEIKPVRKLRDKEIGHLDLPTALGLAPASENARNVKEIDKSLNAIFEIFNFFNNEFFEQKLEKTLKLDGRDEFWLLNILYRGTQDWAAEYKSGEFTSIPDTLRKRHYSQ